MWNWKRLLIIFSTSFPIVLRRTIDQYDLGESNVALLGLGMTTVVEVLKWVSQYPSSMQTLAMSMNLPIQSSSLIIDLIWLHISLFGPGADELLHFLIVSIILFLENNFHWIVGLSGILSRKWVLTSLSWAELKDLWRAFHRSTNSMHSHPLYWIASITGSLRFLTQFISFHGLQFLFAISFIFLSKNEHLYFLTILLKSFQFSRLWDCQYFCSICQQSLFHQALECLVILTIFEYLNQISSILVTKCWTTSSKDLASWISDVFKFLINQVRSSINCLSSSLPLTKEHYLVEMFLSLMWMSTVIRAWLDISLQSGWIWWWLNSIDEDWVKTRSKTKFEFWSLFKNLVGKFSVRLDRPREKESVISNNMSL